MCPHASFHVLCSSTFCPFSQRREISFRLLAFCSLHHGIDTMLEKHGEQRHQGTSTSNPNDTSHAGRCRAPVSFTTMFCAGRWLRCLILDLLGDYHRLFSFYQYANASASSDNSVNAYSFICSIYGFGKTPSK